MAITTYTDTDYAALFKRTYGEYGDNLYGSGVEDVLESQIEKVFDFGGTDHRFPVKLGFGGGTSFGTLGQANKSKNVEVTLTRKAAYARMNLDRQTIVASRGKQAAFKEATSEETMGKLKSFNRTQACALYNDGTGILGAFNAAASGTATAPVVTISTTTSTSALKYQFRQGFFEEGDYVNVVTKDGVLLSSVWEITSVDIANKQLTLSRLSGADDLTSAVTIPTVSTAVASHVIVLQNSYNAAPMGIKGAAEFASGSLYGVTYTRRWSPYLNALATPSLVSVDLLNKMILQMDQRNGEPPTMLIFSTIQMEKFLNQQEDKKRFPVATMESRGNKLMKAAVSFTGIEYMGPRGAIPIMSSRYVRDDIVYAVNTNKMFRKHAEKFGWFDEDRTVLLRMQDQDAYEARYGGYYENFINPFFVGSITGLST